MDFWSKQVAGQRPPPSSTWTTVVKSCAGVLLRENRAHRRAEDVAVGIDMLCDMNRINTMFGHAAAFRDIAADFHSPSSDIRCDSLLSALEAGDDNVDARITDTTAHLEHLAARLRDARAAEDRMLEPPPYDATPQEKLLRTASDIVFLYGLSVVTMQHADRAAMSLGGGLQRGRVTPLVAALVLRNVLHRCVEQQRPPDALLETLAEQGQVPGAHASSLSTEVIVEDYGERVWLRVSRWHKRDTLEDGSSEQAGVTDGRAEHHLVNLTPSAVGSFSRIFPKALAARRRPPENHWVHVLQSVSEAHVGMCDCCYHEHQPFEWFGELCEDMLAELEAKEVAKRSV